jgi:Fe2+ transport system protein FeoA
VSEFGNECAAELHLIGDFKLDGLSGLRVGESGVLDHFDLPEDVQHQLMYMGFVPEARITALRRAPAGDPTVYGVDGMEIALRRETAARILVRHVTEPRQPSSL